MAAEIPTQSSAIPIAIVGMDGLFPDSPSPEEFWAHIVSASCASRRPPPGRWLLEPESLRALRRGQPDAVDSLRGCFLDDAWIAPESLCSLPWSLDNLVSLDPMFRLLLRVGHGCWQDAGLDDALRARCGVIVGNLALPTEAASAWSRACLLPTLETALLNEVQSPSETAFGRQNVHAAGLPAVLLARMLRLGGTRYTLDAACASSLYAIRLAMDELRSGRADVMIAGGLSRPDSLYTQMGFSQLQALSPSGTPAPFDATGDGLVVGEGCGLFVLRRLGDALRDGNRIHGVIHAVGLSNDVSGGMLAPESEGQLRAMRAAYAEAGWSPADVELIECHAPGTPVGDVVEFSSMRALWQKQAYSPGQCVIGSVKSNIGHLLTAAGAAALMKTLLAMRHGILPPTANFSQPAEGIDMERSPFRILQRGEIWRPRGKRRRAAISAFGFGGINAHLLLEAYSPEMPALRQPTRANDEPVAIVAMAARCGPWDTLDTLCRRVFAGDARQPQEPTRWWGAQRQPWFQRAHPDTPRVFAIDTVDAELGAYRIPPADMAEMLPRQLLMLNLVARVLREAGIGDASPSEMGVFIGCGLDMQACNYSARWDIANHIERWRKALGVELDEDDCAAWLRRLRDAISPALNAQRTMGALGSIVASRIAKAFGTRGPAFTIAAESASGLCALEAGLHALRDGALDRVLVGAVDMAADLRLQWTRDDADGRIPLADGGVVLLLKRLRDAKRDGDTVHAVIGSMRRHPEDMEGDTETPLQRIEQRIGKAGCASGLLALAILAQGLRHGLHLPRRGEGEAWIVDRDGEERRVHLRADNPWDVQSLHITLAEAPASAPQHPARPSLPLGCGLFRLTARTPQGLLRALDALQEWAARRPEVSMHELAGLHHRSHPSKAGDACLTLVADDARMLQRQIEYAREQLRAHPDLPIGTHGAQPVPDRRIQDRVFYSREKLAEHGRLAFVFSGSGNHFPGMGRELLRAFTGVIHRQERNSRLLRQQYLPQRVWREEWDENWWEDHNALVISHVALGTAISDLLQGFALRPQAVMGYSLGESTSLFSLGVWRERDTMIERLRASRLFTHELAGPCEAARRHWKLPEHEDVDWRIGMVQASAEAVRERIDAFPRAYLLIVNTPAQCVIGGQGAQVEALAEALQSPLLPLRGVTTVHCEVVTPVAEAYRALHLFDTHPPAGVDFYRFADGERYMPTRESAADAILAQALHGVDFTQVVERAYADGARLFLEVGPGQSCSRMIGEILGARPHMARSSCYAGEPAEALLLRTLAHALAEGLEVDLSVLYPESMHGEGGDAPRVSALREGRDMPSPMPPETKRERSAMASSEPEKDRPMHASAGASPSEGRRAEGAPSSSREAFAGESRARRTDAPNAPRSDIAAWMPALRDWLHARGEAHARYLQFAQNMHDNLLRLATQAPASASPSTQAPARASSSSLSPPRSLDRAQCMEFATGRIARVLGESFAEIDRHPTRVRLPDEPLMLVDRILRIEGEPRSMRAGRVVTEHDVTAERWYLDGGHIPTCVAVEAGQADLFLCAYLGIDFQTRGKAVYRLLDAVVTFHDSLPRVGEVIRYDIHIDEFFRQGNTWLFRFHFESTVDGRPLMSMRKGCAGFFTEEELAAGQGIVHTRLDHMPQAPVLPEDWRTPLPLVRESWDKARIAALYTGDLGACFGAPFDRLPFTPYTLPAQPHMRLVDRVIELDPKGGRCGIGRIRAEMDIRPDDWFLTCHFVDDQVMPGTLMYECCMHTLRIFLLRMGWVGPEGETWCEPVPGVDSSLKCRGQVIASTQVVTYQVDILELGYAPEPYAIAQALMYADGKPIVEIGRMSARMRGLDRGAIESLWAAASRANAPASPRVLYDTDKITAFAIGKPSEAFGERYRVFDEQRRIARLPGPPFQFLDRIVDVQGEAWKMQAGASAVAEYDVPPDAWYFREERQPLMPFSVLLETGLQPCGWLAAYVGSALTSDVDLSFRNLDGRATQYRAVTPESGTLRTTTRLTRVSSSGGMIIQHYDFEIHDAVGKVYDGETVFGFFSREALAQQVGVRGARFYAPSDAEKARALSFPYPREAPYPGERLRMIDEVEMYIADGGPQGLGYLLANKRVDAEEWFFRAHFHQDPVCPGSLGLESFLQLLKLAAMRRWRGGESARFECVALGQVHQWSYRGQIVPSNEKVRVEACITAIDEERRMLTADGHLAVDGKTIYQMRDFTLRLRDGAS